MNRYINADILIAELISKDFLPAIVKRAIENVPTADVVEVVRCKDCRYCEIQELETESERLKARTVDALTEFAESVKRYYSALPGATVGAAVRFYVDEKLKEALDKI